MKRTDSSYFAKMECWFGLLDVTLAREQSEE